MEQQSKQLTYIQLFKLHLSPELAKKAIGYYKANRAKQKLRGVKHNPRPVSQTLSGAIYGGFVWMDTLEGSGFWINVKDGRIS